MGVRWEPSGGGSAVYATKARDKFFGITSRNRQRVLLGIIDNTLFRLECDESNLASRVLALWRKQVVEDWKILYGVKPFGLETFVEFADLGNQKARTGVIYDSDNWVYVGDSGGSAKSHAGTGLTGVSSRERVPGKMVFCKWIGRNREPIEYRNYKSSWRGRTSEEREQSKVLKAKRSELLYFAEREARRLTK